MKAEEPISVLLVEDHALFRVGIKASLEHDQTISVVGESENGFDAVDKAVLLNPDVIVMDISMPVMNGLESTRIIKQRNSHSKIIMLTSHEGDEVIDTALGMGASGFCRKDIGIADLKCAIKSVHAGNTWMDPGLSLPTLIDRSFSNCFLSTTDSLASTEKANLSNTILQPHNLYERLDKQDSESHVIQTLNHKYENLGLLGEGGMSVVYKMRHRVLNKIFAVKFLRSACAKSESALKRFPLEAKATSQLTHENIIGIHDYGFAADGSPFLVMDFIDGPSVADILKQQKNIPECFARRIFLQTAEALAHAHENGILHRDIKPGNVLLTYDANGVLNAKLVDFGLAKFFKGEAQSQQLTQTGEIVGSPLYMSPEQCRGRNMDQRSDIYSLGCLMYEAICGKPPFHGTSVFDTMHMHLHDEPREPNRSLCSPILSSIIYRCLQKNPEQRFNSARDLVTVLA